MTTVLSTNKNGLGGGDSPLPIINSRSSDYNMPKIPYQFSPMPKFLLDKLPATVTAAGLRVLLAIIDVFDHAISKLCTGRIENKDLMARTGLSAKSLQRGRGQLVQAGIITAEQVGEVSQSSRWQYRFTPLALGMDIDVQAATESEARLDVDVQKVDKDVQLLDKDVQAGKEEKERLNAYWDSDPEPSEQEEESDIRISSRNSLNTVIGETGIDSSEVAGSDADATYPPLGMDRSVELVQKMIAGAESVDGEMDLKSDLLFWSLVSQALGRSGAEDMATVKALLSALNYNEMEIKKLWFKELL